ncbi:hypothetical protein C9374_010668 [Naegleria lovaniensis]|uniref:Uncharacterized protein n=1 Tax=Naegleria lovaniensis TaxID=51637 RepID=A0AA88GG33_NAELO|nr:uncharacterized protein C9374_010668 [Naegleria lovaniensis]KAG2374649.1 hypothetical protein C9374_010668 [Naegleria lovaniensis]
MSLKANIISEQPPHSQQHFSHRLIDWLQFLTSQYKCMSHLNLFRNDHHFTTNSSTPISSQKICEIYHSQDEFFMNNGLLFIGIMNHYFPKHVKNPDLASVNFQKEIEVVWTLAHTQLEMPCHYSLEEYHSSVKGNGLNFSKLGKQIEEYYFFFNNDEKDNVSSLGQNYTNSQRKNDSKKQCVISSASSLVTALGNQSVSTTISSKQNSPTTQKFNPKIEDIIVLEYNTHQVAGSTNPMKMTSHEFIQNSTTKKPLPTLPVTSFQDKTTLSLNKTNPQLEKAITQLISEDHEEKEQPVFFSKTAFVDKEDSEEYYQKFKY